MKINNNGKWYCLKLVDENHSKNCVSTDEANKITTAHCMKTEMSDWFVVNKGKKEKTSKKGRKKSCEPEVVTYQCSGGVLDRWMDVTIPNLSAQIVVTRPRTLKYERTTATLFFTGQDGVPQRVVQMETTEPLPEKDSDKGWPHLHYGHQYWKAEGQEEVVDYERNISLFSESSNVELGEIPGNPFEPGDLELT